MPDPNNIALRDLDAVFMLLPKVANTSIKKALLAAQGRTANNVHDSGLFEYVSREEAATFTHRIAFVRDPLRRLASCWRDKFQILSDGRFLPGFRKFGMHQDMAFEEFVELVADIPDADCTGTGDHFRSQAFSLCDGDTVIPDMVGRFETLGDDWERVRILFKDIGGPDLPVLGHEKRSDSGEVQYDARRRALALQRYRHDVRIFGYAPPRKYQIDPDRRTRGRSICNVHREAYRLARDDIADPAASERLMDLIGEAFDMGKRMNAKLRSSQYEA